VLKKNRMTSADNNFTRISCDYGIPLCDAQKWQEKLTLLKDRRPLCIISNWTYWDIKYLKDDIGTLKERGLLPAAIFSENIMWDERHRWPQGSCVKTTWLKRFEHNCVFHTKNTTYLLVGSGTRCSISPDMFNSFHF